MFDNGKGTDWNFPTWEQEQEMKRMAEIQARAYQEAANKAAQQAADRARRAQKDDAMLRQLSQHITDAVTSAPDYEAKRQQTLKKAQEMQSKGGISAAIGAILEAICK
jgi:hypothetical protein